MTEMRFYHLTRSPLERVLPRMLEMTLERGWRAVVVAGGEERVESLNALLWTYDDRTFLPHGSAREGHGADQPVWLTAREENPNGANVAFLLDDAGVADPTAFERCCEIFDGSDEAALGRARERWKRYKDSGLELSYWQQTDQGWEEKG